MCKLCNDSGIYRIGGAPICEPFNTFCSCKAGEVIFKVYADKAYGHLEFNDTYVEATNRWKFKDWEQEC